MFILFKSKSKFNEASTLCAVYGVLQSVMSVMGPQAMVTIWKCLHGDMFQRLMALGKDECLT